MKKILLLTLVASLFATVTNAQLPITKNFDDNSITSGGWSAVSVIGDQVWNADNTYGINSTPCGLMKGHDGSHNENEDWLVSPSINADLYASITFSFWNTSGYTGDALEVFWSNNYSGDPSAATWTEITGITWHDGVTFWEWTYSGDIDLSAMTGNCVIAFKYLSTDTDGKTWELDDISISGVQAINEINKAKIRIYPNPVSDYLYIDAKYKNVEILNITGQVVFSSDNAAERIDVSNLAEGVYFISIDDNGTLKSAKFIVR